MTDIIERARSLRGQPFHEPTDDLAERARKVLKRAEQAAEETLGTRQESNAKAAVQEAEQALIEATRSNSAMAKSNQGRRHLHEGVTAGVAAEDSIAMAKEFLKEIEQQTNSAPQN
ncbi:hypothetical protein ACQCLI_32055 (plasmid) [Pseudomonas nitroreducens]|uniref:hypothetical protein n=1 Tax=Pseudomonas nitroreducens TaxID=46680 RepID=UPI00037D8EDF|nr:hypothetical protein [Pseudomonas nitroreducens]